MTWKDVAARYPEFVQWVVAKYGPLPDGVVFVPELDRFAAAYKEACA